jgi:hypothetical protein
VTRTPWVVMIVLVVVLGGATAIALKDKDKTAPRQEASRLLRVPTEKARVVIVPPCGTGVNVASETPKALRKTPGTIAFRLAKGRGDRLVLVPRCRASQGAAASEGVELPSAAFILPIGAQVTAGRGGSAEAGTERVESQLFVPANSTIKTIVVTRCIETAQEAQKTATGRTLILNPQRGRPTEALGPPC